MTVTILYTATAMVAGGRNGHTQNSDGIISVDTLIAKAMGGPGRSRATTLEDFFACGYAAGIGTQLEGGFGLTVDLCAHVGGLSQADADSLIAKAHEICPYSDATRNNNTVALRASVS